MRVSAAVGERDGRRRAMFFEVEEGCLCDLFDVFVVGEGLVKYDA